jgi:ech hydrogenase subunit D
MKRIETTLDTLKTDIGNFYKVDLHHFIVMNIVDLGEKLEVQWFFCDYAQPCDVTMFVAQMDPAAQIPSICGSVVSAWVAEAELVDLMGINIENAKKGFVLEDDFEGSPLRKKK